MSPAAEPFFSCTQTNTNTLLLMTAPDQEELIDEMMNEIMTEAESDTHTLVV